MIKFMKYKMVYLIISSVVIVPGLVSLFTFGLKPSIDFTGGTQLDLVPKTPNQSTPSAAMAEASTSGYVKKIKSLLNSNKVEFESVKPSGSKINLRLKEIDEKKKNELVSLVSKNVVLVAESRFETLGPTLGRELIVKTIIGVVLASLLIALYVIYQFKDRLFGVCAVLATIHDSLVILGVFSLLGRFWGVEIDTLFVTAVLTVLSFSVHDTIVVYDRIREKIRLSGRKFSGLNHLELEGIIDGATNETLVRSINNSVTIIFMLTALFVLGGDSVKWFSAALLVGTVSGVYSSPFVAGPLLIIFKKFMDRPGASGSLS